MAGGKILERELDFPEFIPGRNRLKSQRKMSQTEVESELEDVCNNSVKEARGNNGRMRRRERLIAKIVQKLKEELRGASHH